MRLLRYSGSTRPGFEYGHTRGPSWATVVGSLLLALAMASLPGCQKENPLPPLAPVKGKVTGPNGKPLTSGNVVLHPQKVDKDMVLPPSSGQISSDGTYEIFTGGKAGAPLGLAKVTITPDMTSMVKGGAGQKASAKGNLNLKYMNPNETPLQYTVVEGAGPGTYDLKLK
jgi:hypothetical protein